MQQKVNRLFQEQLKAWPLLGENWKHLDETLLKSFDFKGTRIRVQFNPRRITSSAARVDRASIEKRPCFLCPSNRPSEETWVSYGDDYEIMCNPFPIFRKHYTITKLDHSPQTIDSEFPRLLDLAKDLPELVIFYNAPGCGASAPDHMHFQAGNRGFLPIENELKSLMEKYGKSLYKSADRKLSAVDDGLRRFLVLESASKEPIELFFTKISAFLKELVEGEPMLNILAYFHEKWQILVFPREKHRPWQYFAEGSDNILLSPASVDMGGVMITPLEKDYLKIRKEDLADIFSQIGPSDLNFDRLCAYLKERM